MIDYNNHGCLSWNDPNNNFLNIDSKYEEVLVNTGSLVKGQWENSIAVIHNDNIPKIITTSNHFIDGTNWGAGYNAAYKIYENIVRNFYQITDKNLEPDLSFYDEKEYFYLITPFCFSNSGHDLSTMLDYYNYILKNDIKDIIILKGYKETNNYKILSLIFKDDLNIHELDLEKVYKFKNIIIIKQVIYNIFNHKYIIEDIKNKIIELYSEQYKDFQNMKLILMKTNRNKNVMAEFTRFTCEKILCKFEENGYINIIPEDTNPFKLTIMLLFANTIVFSVGSVLYTNKIFFNKTSKHILMTVDNNINCTDGLNVPGVNYNIISFDKNNLDCDDSNLDRINEFL